jgi:glycosyltransferase involved in cell wall biosynthesis
MNNESNELSVVLPVFNEQRAIAKVVKEIHDYLENFVNEFEIIAVNDGSTDQTLAILNDLGSSLIRLKVISHEENRGYGQSLISGIQIAQKSWVLLIDSDGQFHINAVSQRWSVRHQYDILLAYRQKRAEGGYRLTMGKMGNFLADILLDYSIKDINCGFKIFRRELIQSVPLSTSGGIINFEILYRLFKRNQLLRIEQFPVYHYPREGGRSTGGDFRVISKIIKEGIQVLVEK